MSKPADAHPDTRELDDVLDWVHREARAYLANLDERPARSPSAESILDRFNGPLPESPAGAIPALTELLEQGLDASVASAGPRVYHFVIGGTTPAALGGDMIASVLDQVAYAWVSSPLATHLEKTSLRWLKELFELDPKLEGVMTTGATMANFVGLATARQWWGRRLGVDVSQAGLAGLPTPRVLSSGYVHASAVKSLAMLGMGRDSLRIFKRDDAGRLDLAAMRAELERDHSPAIIIANAGEVNAGDLDPLPAIAELAEKHGAWLHVDGAFGLFARISDRTRHLLDGLERADSVTVDGHKWLNVAYDCGFAFVRDKQAMLEAFAYSAHYLATHDDERPTYGCLGPESSRRARALGVWATLRAYARAGHRAIVENHLDLAQHMARLVDDAPDLERLADVQLNIVCFRFNPGNLTEDALNTLNRTLADNLIADGRVYAGATLYEGRVALRPAISNWRTREHHIEEFVAVVRELGARLS